MASDDVRYPKLSDVTLAFLEAQLPAAGRRRLGACTMWSRSCASRRSARGRPGCRSPRSAAIISQRNIGTLSRRSRCRLRRLHWMVRLFLCTAHHVTGPFLAEVSACLQHSRLVGVHFDDRMLLQAVMRRTRSLCTPAWCRPAPSACSGRRTACKLCLQKDRKISLSCWSYRVTKCRH